MLSKPYICIQTETCLLHILYPLTLKWLFQHWVFYSFHLTHNTINPALPDKNSSRETFSGFECFFLPERPTTAWHIFTSCAADKAVLGIWKARRCRIHSHSPFLTAVQPSDLKALKNKIGINAFMLGDVHRSSMAGCSGFHNHYETWAHRLQIRQHNFWFS